MLCGLWLCIVACAIAGGAMPLRRSWPDAAPTAMSVSRESVSRQTQKNGTREHTTGRHKSQPTTHAHAIKVVAAPLVAARHTHRWTDMRSRRTARATAHARSRRDPGRRDLREPPAESANASDARTHHTAHPSPHRIRTYMECSLTSRCGSVSRNSFSRARTLFSSRTQEPRLRPSIYIRMPSF